MIVRRVLAAFLAIAFALLCASCLPFEDDVELTFGVHGTAAAVIDLRTLVRRRLAAGGVSADVRDDDGRVHVVLDERLAPSATELLTWRSGVELAATAPDAAFEPSDPSELVAIAYTLPDGTVERAWEGPKRAVLRAVAAARLGPALRVVAEALPASSRDAGRWRTRVVQAEPRARIEEDVLVAWDDGPSLLLRPKKGSAAEAAFVLATRRHDEPRAPREVLVRGQISLGLVRPSAGGLVVAFGEGPLAYERAHDERLLLTSGVLPPLVPLGAVGLPPERVLGIACIVLPVLLSFVWLGFVRRFDRAHPEPLWLIGVTFVLGAVSTVPAALLEAGFGAISPWLDPRLATLGGRFEALPLSIVVLSITVGGSEELAKLAAAAFAARRPELDEPVDGIVYGVTAALGFAAAENVQYFAASRLAAPAVLARCFLSIPAHVFLSAIWGAALGARLVDRRHGRVARSVVLAAVAHGLFDALLLTDGMAPLALALNVVLASAFVALTRRALRHGIVPASPLAPIAERRLFPVGRPKTFVACAILVHVLALVLFLLGGAYQMARHRPSAVFVIGSTVVVLLLAMAAWGITHAMVLDVVVDAHGITFGGATRAWDRVRGYVRRPAEIEIDAAPSPLVLGPGRPEVLDAIASALDEHVPR